MFGLFRGRFFWGGHYRALLRTVMIGSFIKTFSKVALLGLFLCRSSFFQSFLLLVANFVFFYEEGGGSFEGTQ